MVKYSTFYRCTSCDAVMNPTTVEYSDLYECAVQFYECPSCGHIDHDIIGD